MNSNTLNEIQILLNWFQIQLDLDSIEKEWDTNYSDWSLTVSWVNFIHEQMCFTRLVFFSKFPHFPSPSSFSSPLFLHPLPMSFLFLCPSRKSSSPSVFPKTWCERRRRRNASCSIGFHAAKSAKILILEILAQSSVATGSSAEWDKPVTKWARNEFFWDSHLRVSLVTLPSEPVFFFSCGLLDWGSALEMMSHQHLD